MPVSNQKLSVAGRLVELYTFEKPIAYDYERPAATRGRREAAKAADKFDPSKQSAAHRAKAKLRRLCHANSWKWEAVNGKVQPPIFNTFTFADNVTDPKFAHAEFSKAMERLNYQWREFVPDGLKYVAVPERQKRGAIHYHQVVFNQPYIPRLYDSLAKTWGNGFVLVKTANTSRQLVSYLSKYLTKDLLSARGFNGKRYFVSRGLIPPDIYRKPAYIKLVLDVIPPNAPYWEPKEPIVTEKMGKIYYRRWMLDESLPLVPTEQLFTPNDASKVGGDDATISVPTDALDEPETHHSVMPFNN